MVHEKNKNMLCSAKPAHECSTITRHTWTHWCSFDAMSRVSHSLVAGRVLICLKIRQYSFIIKSYTYTGARPFRGSYMHLTNRKVQLCKTFGLHNFWANNISRIIRTTGHYDSLERSELLERLRNQMSFSLSSRKAERAFNGGFPFDLNFQTSDHCVLPGRHLARSHSG